MQRCEFKTLRKALLFVFALQISASACAVATVGDARIGVSDTHMFINLQDLASSSLEGLEVEKGLKKLQEEAEKDVMKMSKQLELAEKELDAKRSALSPEALAKESQKIQTLRKQIEEAIKRWQDILQSAMQREFEKLSQQLVKIVEAYARKHGYKVVCDVATGRPIWIADALNKTDDILKIMNDNYKAEQAKKKPAAAAAVKA